MSQAAETSVFPAFSKPPAEGSRQRPLTTQQPPVEEPATPEPQTPSQPVPTAPPIQQQYPSQQNDYALMQAEAAYNSLNDAYAQQQQQLAALQQENQQFRNMYQRAQLASTVPADYFSSLSSIDEEDAKKINNASIAAVQAAVEPLRQELARTQQWVSQQNAEQKQNMERARIAGFVQQVLQVHPDYYDLAQTPQYHAFINERDGLSSQTRDQRATQELRNGNTAYVIDLLRQFKDGNPSTQSIASVAPVQAAQSYGNSTNARDDKPSMTLRDLNNLYQMGQIQHGDYVAEAKRIKASMGV